MEVSIRNVRKMKGIRSEDMAKALNVTLQTYRKYERNPEEMKVKHARIIAKILKMPIQVFFYEES